MNFELSDSINVLDSSNLFDEREKGVTHTNYETEVIFYSCIRNGDVENVQKMMHFLFKNTVVVGRMSGDELCQMKYWAVCCVTLATRYAIDGGLDETAAFNMADESIMTVDKMSNREDIFNYLQKMCVELTQLVAKSKSSASYPYAVKKCLRLINMGLHGKLSVHMLAEQCELSPDYLTVIFKRATGKTIPEYIKAQRLSVAKELLLKAYSCSEVAYYLGFCSESYFIKCFREEFGITPKKFANSAGKQ